MSSKGLSKQDIKISVYISLMKHLNMDISLGKDVMIPCQCFPYCFWTIKYKYSITIDIYLFTYS